MTRPTVLDMDLVVVPSKADVGMLGAWYRYKIGHRFYGEEPARDTSDVGAYSAMLSASPYPTAWDDVRKYVEGLEAQLVAVAGPCSLGVGCEQYGVCYADAHGKPEECGKPSFECEALKDARRIADHDKKLWLAAEARIAELEKEKHAALTMIAMLEKRLATAERVISKQRDALHPLSDAVFNDNGDITVNLSMPTGEEFIAAYFAVRAARAYMEGK